MSDGADDTASSARSPIVVDMDGTILCSDTLIEGITAGLFQKPFMTLANCVVAATSIPRSVALFAGAYALLGGIVSFSGWAFGVERFADWNGSGIAMKANTALAAAVAGAALLIAVTRSDSRPLVRGLGWLVAALGGLTLLEHVTGWNLGIDTLLFDEAPDARATAAPGRMGPPAATSFLLLGSALALLTRGWHERRIAVGLAIVTFLISLLSITGYAYQAEAMFVLPKLTGIAVQTATMLGALAIGVIAAAPDHEPVATLCADSSAGVLARRLLPFVLLTPLLIGWLRLKGQQMGLYDTAFGVAVRTVVETALLAALIFWGLRAIRTREAERDRLDSALRATERRLAGTLESISDGLMTLDGDWRFTYVNREAERLLGRSRDDLLGRILWDLYPELIGSPNERRAASVTGSVRTPSRGRDAAGVGAGAAGCGAMRPNCSKGRSSGAGRCPSCTSTF